jgi:ABC-type transport system substrate-binding protein
MRQIGKIMTNMAVFTVLFIGIGVFLTVSPAIADTKPQYGGELRFLGETDAMGFDAIKARVLVGGARMIGNLVMEKLFERGEKNELIPILGLSARKSKDGKVWTIQLRKGVKFHDGTPFNADAVVKHWQRLLNPKNRFRGLLLLRPVASVEKLSEYEVRFVLKHAWLPFLGFLTNPSGFTALIPSPKAVKDGTHNRAPVGTGPFVFKEWKIGDRIVAIKNHDYWQKDKPYLDKVVARAIPDHESRYAALISGQADIMITDRPTHVKKLAKNSDFVKFPLKWRGAGILVLNNNKAPLDDIRVRRALALAWDQKRYIKASFQNIMPYTEHWFGDSLNCSNNNYPSPDIAKARALIADYGKPVELEYVHSATNRGREAGIIMQQMFKRIGVRVNPVSMDFAGIMNKLLSKNFDITSWVIPGAYDMGPITTAILHSKHPFNMSGYANKEVEKLLFKQRMSTDPETRKKILCKIVQKVNSETPFIYLFGRTYYLFAKKNVKNVKLPVLGEEGIQLADIWLN